MRSARWMRPGTYSRPPEPMPQACPSLAPLVVTHIGPVGPSMTCGMRSLMAAEACSVKSVGGSQQRSMWQSAEIISYRMARSPLLDQPVELPRVLAGHLVRHLRGQVPELLLDVLGRLRPHSVAVRIVGAPHERLHPHVLDELGADPVEREGRLALPPPVVAGLHLEPQVVEAVLPLEVHAVEGVGNPADAALA